MTERFHSRATLTRLRRAIEQSSEAVVITDTRALIEYVNPAFERITGYAAAEVIGQNPRLLQGGQKTAAYYETMWATLASGRPWIADFVNRRKDGSTYDASSVISPIRADDGGAISGYVAVSRDVSAERRNEKQAARVARERALICRLHSRQRSARDARGDGDIAVHARRQPERARHGCDVLLRAGWCGYAIRAGHR